MFGKVGILLSLLSFPLFCVGLLARRDEGLVLGIFVVLGAAFLIALERRLARLERQPRPERRAE